MKIQTSKFALEVGADFRKKFLKIPCYGLDKIKTLAGNV